jgi:hypothetical protein
VTISEKNNPEEKYLCVGLIRIDGTWTDLFLEDGGLDAALRQREALAANPNLVKGRFFKCDDADEIQRELHDGLSSNLKRL